MKKNQPPNTEWREWQGYRYPARHSLRTVYSLIPIFWPLASLVCPFLANWLLQKALRKYPGAAGRIGKLQMGFTKMHVTLKDVNLSNFSVGSNLGVNISAGFLRISLSGDALRKGILACSIEAIDLYVGIHEDEKEVEGSSPGEIPPFFIEALSVNRSTVRVDMASAKTPLHIVAESIWIKASRISMLPSNEELPVSIDCGCKLFDGDLKLNAKANFTPCAFDVNAQLEKANLVMMNDYLRTFGKIDVHAGEMSLYLEAIGKEGKYKGYLKPILSNLDLVGPEDRNDSILKKIWERIVAGIFSLLKNRKNNQIATRIAFEGSYDLRINVFQVIGQALRNAFIDALKPGLDGIISFPENGNNNHKDPLPREARTRPEAGGEMRSAPGAGKI